MPLTHPTTYTREGRSNRLLSLVHYGWHLLSTALVTGLLLGGCGHEQASGGWSTSPDQHEAVVILEDHTAVSIGCDPAARFGTELNFHYAPFPDDLESGYVSWTRWAFFNADGELVLSGDQEFIDDITSGMVEALISANLLIFEMHAEKASHPEARHMTSDEGHRWEGETEWRRVPPVYFHRKVFDLTVGRDALIAVLDRCTA